MKIQYLHQFWFRLKNRICSLYKSMSYNPKKVEKWSLFDFGEGVEIGNYIIKREIGKGGMATIYLAHHKDVEDLVVAIKVIDLTLLPDDELKERVVRGIKIVARIKHHNIIKISNLDFSKDQSKAYITMEYLPGGDLKELLQKEGKLSLEVAFGVLEKIGGGLQALHQEGFIHRDVKPANVLFRNESDPVLIDFDIAKMTDATLGLTQAKDTLGTVRYMSPEQTETSEIDHRSDIYSLGLVFYEMLVGKPAVLADNTAQAIRSHVLERPPELPIEYSYLQPALNKALAKSPVDRYGNVAEFIESIKISGNIENETQMIFSVNGNKESDGNTPNNESNKPIWVSSIIGMILVFIVAITLANLDDDKDGVVSIFDQCPDTSSDIKVDNKGCELDGDNDGIKDSSDKCAATAAGAKVDKAGCELDSDNDGVKDSTDNCPATLAEVKVDAQGCELDSDNDGVKDSADKCADTTEGAKVDKVGCEVDTDQDGVKDSADRCSFTLVGAKVDAQGCELDSDRDGVADGIDLCPDSAAGDLVNQVGCSLEANGEPISLAGVQFQGRGGSDVLTIASHTILDEAIASLKKFPELYIEISGHTDSAGNNELNLNLSQARAEAVKRYFVSNGINVSHLKTKGYGEKQPIADNATAAGRATNRRVELRIWK